MSISDEKLAAIARAEAEFGPDDVKVADALEDYAAWYAANRIYSGAEAAFRRSLAIREQQLGADLAVADAWERWARAAENKKRPEALDLFRKGFEVREAVLGPGAPALQPFIDDLAERYLATDRAEASGFLQRGLALAKRAEAPAGPAMAARLLRFSKFLLAEGRPAEAEPLLRRALEIADEADTLDALIEALIAQDRGAEAAPLLGRSLRLKAAAADGDASALLDTISAAIGHVAAFGAIDDITALLQGVPAAEWPRALRLLHRLSQQLVRHGRVADAEAAGRSSAALIERLLRLDDRQRFAALSELWADRSGARFEEDLILFDEVVPASYAPASQRVGPSPRMVRFEHAEASAAPPEASPAPPPRRPARNKKKTQQAAEIERGKLIERIPRNMVLRERYPVEIRLGREAIATELMAAAMSGDGEIAAWEMEIVQTMSIDLSSPDGAFRIEAASPSRQLVKHDAQTSARYQDFASQWGRWVWYVEPLKRGAHPLSIKVSASVVDGLGVAAETVLPDRIIPVVVSIGVGKTTASLLWRTTTLASGATVTGVAGGLAGGVTKDFWWPHLSTLLQGFGF